MAEIFSSTQSLLTALIQSGMSWLAADIERALLEAGDKSAYYSPAGPLSRNVQSDGTHLGNLEASWPDHPDGYSDLSDENGQITFTLDMVHAAVITPILQFARTHERLETLGLSEFPPQIANIGTIKADEIEILYTPAADLMALMREIGQRPEPKPPTDTPVIPGAGPRRR